MSDDEFESLKRLKDLEERSRRSTSRAPTTTVTTAPKPLPRPAPSHSSPTESSSASERELREKEKIIRDLEEKLAKLDDPRSHSQARSQAMDKEIDRLRMLVEEKKRSASDSRSASASGSRSGSASGSRSSSRSGSVSGSSSVSKTATSSPSSVRSSSTSASASASASASVLGPSSKSDSMRAREMRIEELKRILWGLESDTSTAHRSATTSDLDAEIARLRSKLEGGGSISETRAKLSERERERDQYVYGVDVCFAMDCTGSMAKWIQEAKDKISLLAREVKLIKASRPPIIRIAFVGYRDHCDSERFVLMDFFNLEDASSVSSFQALLGRTPASGGGDFPEDIAGAMRKMTELSWKASTRLVIHFGDAPCHGAKYHPYDDSCPAGCPEGLVPEELLRKLASKSVYYYFGEITHHTRQMTDIFARTLADANKAEMFKVIPMSEGASAFLPSVISSIRASMSRSAVFGLA